MAFSSSHGHMHMQASLESLPDFSKGQEGQAALTMLSEDEDSLARLPKLEASQGFNLEKGCPIVSRPSAEDGPGKAPTAGARRLCVRHQRMADNGAAKRMQESIENLSLADQSAVNTIWSLFSSCKGPERVLVLRGLLSICCPSQLSFLSEQIKAECRMDPFSLLPREVSIRCLSYLDAISLGRAAQVSKAWRELADDDVLWRTMCQQHIERKCEKCGWGLPLLEKKRRARAAVVAKQGRAQQGSSSTAPAASPPRTPSADRTDMAVDGDCSPSRPAKRTRDADAWMDLDGPPASSRSRPSSRAASRPSSPPLTKPWKAVYTERLVVERNWRRGSCAVKIFEGHTDAVTCLQFDETLASPSFPVLMTGSWDRTVRIWNMETGACVNVLRGHQRGVRALQFDSNKLITGSMDATLKIWSWRTGECVRTLQGHRDSVICLAYDRHLLASGSADSTIKLWDFSTGECITFRGHREWVNALQIWSPDECEDPNETDAALNPLHNAQLRAGDGPPPRLKLLFSGSDDGTIRVWDLWTRQCVRVLHGHVAQVQSLRVISVPGIVPVMPSAVIGKAAVSLQDYFGATADTSAPPSFAGIEATEGESEDAELAPLDFGTATQPMLISASLDNTIKVWDIEQGKCDRTFFGHVEGVWAVDSDRLRIISGSHDRTIKVWDRSTGRYDKIVSGGDDSTVRLWSFGAEA